MKVKKSAKQALKPQQKSDIEALRGTTGLRDNPLHNEIGYLKSLKTMTKKSAAKPFKTILKSDMAADVKNTVATCMDSTSCLINNAAEVSNCTTNLATDLTAKYANFAGAFLKQNMDAGQKLLNCRDAGDTLKFQQKLFRDNFSSLVNMSLDVMQAMQEFTSKSLASTIEYADRNVKCLTRFGG